MTTFRFVVELDIELESGPRVRGDIIHAELTAALDTELPTTLWLEPDGASEESGYKVKSTITTPVA